MKLSKTLVAHILSPRYYNFNFYNITLFMLTEKYKISVWCGVSPFYREFNLYSFTITLLILT